MTIVPAVAALWRYPVKSMQGEELNASDVTTAGLVGDRGFALVDQETGKVAGAKNPRKWPGFFQFRASYVTPPAAGEPLPAVRVTLPDGTCVTSDEAAIARRLSAALGRDVAFVAAAGPAAAPAMAEGYDVDSDDVLDFEMPAGYRDRSRSSVAVVTMCTGPQSKNVPAGISKSRTSSESTS